MVAPSKRIEEAGLGKMPERAVSRSYPHVAEAMRARRQNIMTRWTEQTMLESPELNRVSVQDFRDEVEQILSSMADAIESGDRSRWLGLAETSKGHGYDRFNLDYTLADLLAEERTLRRVIVEQIEVHLDRDLKSDEATSVHTAIDFMVQQGVLAMAQEQKETLRAASESQIKYLSFVSHDLANNLMVIRMRMETVIARLKRAGGFDDSVDMLTSAIGTIQNTVQGTRRLVEYQTLRKRKLQPSMTDVHLREEALMLVDVVESYAKLNKVRFNVPIDEDARAHTDPNLLTLILQNLINNAIKHARPDGGTVTIDAARHEVDGGDRHEWTISVADQGPGFPEETRQAILNACADQEDFGAQGLGLGMAIACQAAQLLKSRIRIENRSEGGSIVSFSLPVAAADARRRQ